jgi:hypothetical protein
MQEGVAQITPRSFSHRAFEVIVVGVSVSAVALPGIMVATLIAATGRKHEPNRCRSCGYNLTGNTSARSSECGESL